jgi:hypothetical protein
MHWSLRSKFNHLKGKVPTDAPFIAVADSAAISADQRLTLCGTWVE